MLASWRSRSDCGHAVSLPVSSLAAALFLVGCSGISAPAKPGQSRTPTDSGTEVSSAPVAQEASAQPAQDAECVEGHLTAQNIAQCKIQRYSAYSANKAEFSQRMNSAQELYREGEENFTAGNYRQAYMAFSTSTVWLPSSKAMIRAGDALFHMHAAPRPSGGAAGETSKCSERFVREAELQLPQTYDAALIFHEFEKQQPGNQTNEQELEEARQRSACLKQLADQYRGTSASCVEKSLISSCLEHRG